MINMVKMVKIMLGKKNFQYPFCFSLGLKTGGGAGGPGGPGFQFGQGNVDPHQTFRMFFVSKSRSLFQIEYLTNASLSGRS